MMYLNIREAKIISISLNHKLLALKAYQDVIRGTNLAHPSYEVLFSLSTTQFITEFFFYLK